jgi:hypothetical protein
MWAMLIPVGSDIHGQRGMGTHPGVVIYSGGDPRRGLCIPFGKIEVIPHESHAREPIDGFFYMLGVKFSKYKGASTVSISHEDGESGVVAVVAIIKRPTAPVRISLISNLLFRTIYPLPPGQNPGLPVNQDGDI